MCPVLPVRWFLPHLVLHTVFSSFLEITKQATVTTQRNQTKRYSKLTCCVAHVQKCVCACDKQQNNKPQAAQNQPRHKALTVDEVMMLRQWLWQVTTHHQHAAGVVGRQAGLAPHTHRQPQTRHPRQAQGKTP